MSATDVATLFLGPGLRIKRFTPRLNEVFNVKWRDLDRPIGDLTHSLDYLELEQDAQRVAREQTLIERHATDRSGRAYIVRLSPYRVEAEQQVEGVVVTFVDVTALKHAESALRSSQQMLASELETMRRLHAVSAAVTAAETLVGALELTLEAALDLQGADLGVVQLLDGETAQLRVFAQRGGDTRILDHLSASGLAIAPAAERALRERTAIHIDDLTRDPSGELLIAENERYRALQSTALIGRDGSLLGVLSVCFREPHPFTERDRQLGDLLARQAADLVLRHQEQDRLAALNRALEERTRALEASGLELARQAAELREQDRHREDFLAALGHELRNPMAAIQNSLEVIAPANERSRRAVGILQRQSRHMGRLINDLLDVSRVKYGRLQLELTVLDLVDTVDGAIETVRAQAESRGLKLSFERPARRVRVMADPERLAQVLDNLLRNAVTYTPSGEIRVALHEAGSSVRVSVADTGVGIAPEDQAPLFEPYQPRLNGRNKGGLGLGLAVAKGLIEAHGGSIECRSEGRGKGSEFIFTLPLSAAERGPAAPDIPRPPVRRVLVVDDQQDVAETFAALLESLGQQVSVAYDGETALRLARTLRPQIAFLDWSMPTMSGPELARKLRAEFHAQELKLVAVTGFGASRTAAGAGLFAQFLLKPATPEQVADVLSAQ